MMIPKRQLLTLIFACLCFKKSLLIKNNYIIIITVIIITIIINSNDKVNIVLKQKSTIKKNSRFDDFMSPGC